MRVRGWVLAAVILWSVRSWSQGKPCRVEVIEGEVKAGQSLIRPIGNGLALEVDALAAGWIIRVEPAVGPRPDHDYAELATPPYESINPLLISTDFSFRAQDAVAWNPRRFRFAASAAQHAGLQDAYQKLRGPGAHTFGQPFAGPPSAQAELARRIGESSEGTLEILDAHLVAGTADQAPAAAAVASHFGQTAHHVEQPANGRTTPLGVLTWLRFRVKLDLPSSSESIQHAAKELQPCGKK